MSLPRKSASGPNVHTLFDSDSNNGVVHTAGTFSELNDSMKAQVLQEVPSLAKVLAENDAVIKKKYNLQKSLKENSPAEQEKKRKRAEEKERKKKEKEDVIRKEEAQKQSLLFQQYAKMKNEVHDQIMQNMYSQKEIDLTAKPPVKFVATDTDKDGMEYMKKAVQQIKETALTIVKISSVEKDKRVELTNAILDLKYNAMEKLGMKASQFEQLYNGITEDCPEFVKLKTIENGKKLCQLILKYPRLKYTSASWTWMQTNCDWLAAQIEKSDEERRFWSSFGTFTNQNGTKFSVSDFKFKIKEYSVVDKPVASMEAFLKENPGYLYQPKDFSEAELEEMADMSLNAEPMNKDDN